MRLLRGAFIVALLTSSAAPAEAGGKRPALVVAVDKGDGKGLAKLLKKAKPKDLDAFDDKTGSPTAGLRAIEVAAKKGDQAAVDALLAAGATATARSLEYAAERGELAIVQRLVDAKAPRADLALTAAAKAGRAEVVKLLLPAAKTADPYFNLDQVLEFAIFFPATPSAPVVDLLVKAGAKTQIQWGPGKQTVLHLAVAKGASDVVDVLLAAGAPVDADDGEGMTPFLSALRGARLEIAGRLLDAKADPKRVTPRGAHALSLLVALDPASADVVAMFDRLLKAGVPVDHAGPDRMTALMVAAGAGSKPWVEKLLARGASTSAASAETFARFPIDFALTCNVDAGTWAPSTISACHADVALLLLADRRSPPGNPDRNFRSPLMRGLMTGNHELVLRLLRLGDMVSADPAGNTPLHYAARYATAQTMTALLGAKHKKFYDVANQQGETALSIARAAGKAEVEQALLAAGATK